MVVAAGGANLARQSIVVAYAFMVAACADPAPLRIAVVGNRGAPIGAVLAVEDINAAGGINGRLLQLGVVDETGNVTPAGAIATAESLAANREILAVIGHGGSATSLAASQVYNTRRVPQIAPNTSSPLYTRAGEYSFRVVASDEHQAEFIAANIERLAPGARVAILYTNDDYGKALSEHLRQALARRRVTPVHNVPFVGGVRFGASIEGIVSSLRATNPQLLVWIGLSPELRALRPHLRQTLPQLRVFASDGASFLGADAPYDVFRDDLLVAYTDVRADRPGLRRLAARLAPAAGQSLTDGVALTYDAVVVVAEALRAGARTRRDIQQYLADGATTGRAYEGVTGAIVLDENGDARPSYVLLSVTPVGPRAVGQ
jgi:branched-chain amino acid transport system substrate-binding protein